MVYQRLQTDQIALFFAEDSEGRIHKYEYLKYKNSACDGFVYQGFLLDENAVYSNINSFLNEFNIIELTENTQNIRNIDTLGKLCVLSKKKPEKPVYAPQAV
jgi:hypothetical protein